MPKKPQTIRLEIDPDAAASVEVRRGFRGRRELNVMFRKPEGGFAKGLTVILSDEDAERLVTEINRTIATRAAG